MGGKGRSRQVFFIGLVVVFVAGLLLLAINSQPTQSNGPSNPALRELSRPSLTFGPLPTRPATTTVSEVTASSQLASGAASPTPTEEIFPEIYSISDFSGEALKQVLSNETLKPTPNLLPIDSRYKPIAAPSISLKVFQQILADGHSPALPEAANMYEVCLREGCDPAVALAFFDHESSLGTQGVAVQTRSLGNIRCRPEIGPCLNTGGNGSFQIYPSWTKGIEAWAILLRDTYLGKYGFATLEQIIPRYAPGDQAIRYIKVVKVTVDNLRLKGRLR